LHQNSFWLAIHPAGPESRFFAAFVSFCGGQPLHSPQSGAVAAAWSQVVSGSMAGDLLDRLFEGSLADMVSHLLTTREVSPDELKKLERLIAERKKRK
jgi:hypothetical protein